MPAWADASLHSPDDERLLLVALCCEGNDVVAAAELRKGMALGISLQLNTAAGLYTVHNTCTNSYMLMSNAFLQSRERNQNQEQNKSCHCY